MMKDEREDKFATTAPKAYGYRVQKDGHEIKDSGFIKAKRVKKLASKELTFHDFDKFVKNILNKPLAKERMILRTDNHKVYTVARSNIAHINYSDDKDIPDSIEELKKI